MEQGLLWYYRGIIRYMEKEHQKPERLEKDRNIILDRIRRAGDHKRWGRAPWQIEGETSKNGAAGEGSKREEDRPAPGDDVSASADLTVHPFSEQIRGREREDAGRLWDSRDRLTDFTPNLVSEATIKKGAAKFDMISDPVSH